MPIKQGPPWTCAYCQAGEVNRLPAKCPNCGHTLRLSLAGKRTTIEKLVRRVFEETGDASRLRFEFVKREG